VTKESVNEALKAASEGPMKGIMAYETNELVSSDFKGNPFSSIVDSPLTKTVAATWPGHQLVRQRMGLLQRVKDLWYFSKKQGSKSGLDALLRNCHGKTIHPQPGVEQQVRLRAG